MAFVRTPLGDPAADAARFLRRLAFIILFIVAPLSEVLSHGLIYVLLPIGAAVFVIAAFLDSGDAAPRRLLTGLLAALVRPVGLAAGFLAFWAALSLIWTPFPADAIGKLARTLLTVALAMVSIIALPERSKVANIYLLPIGIAATALATCVMLLVGLDWFRLGQTGDSILAQRCIMSLVMLLWAGVAGLALRQRFILAAALAFTVAAAALTGFVPAALTALMMGALVYAAAMSRPLRAARVIAIAFVVLILGAPLFVVLLNPLLAALKVSLAGPIGIFANLVVHEWPRFVTGHGLDMAERAIDLGILPPETPRSFVFLLWYELGVVGVAGFLFLLTTVLEAAAALPAHAAPAVLATLTAGLIIGLFGAETTQLWWETLLGIVAIALALIARAHPRAQRPRAPAATAGVADEEATRRFDRDAAYRAAAYPEAAYSEAAYTEETYPEETYSEEAYPEETYPETDR